MNAQKNRIADPENKSRAEDATVNSEKRSRAGIATGNPEKKSKAGSKGKKNPKQMARKRQDLFRLLIQIIFFIAAPSVYASAFTAAKNVFSTFGTGDPLEFSSFAVLFILVIVYTVFCGRFFCGWACAFGALGDWVYRISQWIQKKIRKKLPKMSEQTVHLLQWGKYLVLTIVLAMCLFGHSGTVNASSPWTVFSLVRSGHFELLQGRVIGITLTILVLAGMAWKERFFCQFLCPMGAIFTMVPVIPFLHLKRHSEACPAKCGACHKNCPVDLFLDTEDAKNGECIRCGRCSGICPKGNISTMGRFKGNELWIDAIKAAVLLALILILE